MFVNCHLLPNQLNFRNSSSFQISKTMLTNQVRELDFRIGRRGGHIEIKGCRNSNGETLVELTYLELITLPDFCKGNDNLLIIIRNGKRKLTIDFYPKFSQYR